ncbi:MAG: hypothetical protein K0R51_184 [Cytophagaceae bacterium]|jgi:hypothetical protein|nr:hypothetical protein [Cytophagaceae bacterium]
MKSWLQGMQFPRKSSNYTIMSFNKTDHETTISID